jgi:hypothetical protein
MTWTGDLLQLELGSTATTYEPFEAHDLYLTAPEGRSVPSAKDSVEVQDGELVYVKRVENINNDVTPVYSQDAWATTDGFIGVGATLDVISTVGSLRGTATTTYAYTTKDIPNILGKTLVLRVRSSTALTFRIDGGIGGSTGIRSFPVTTDYKLLALQIPTTLSATILFFGTGSCTVGDWFEIDWIWIGGKANGAAGIGTAIDLGSTFENIQANYQLATPITTPIDSDGNIPAGALVLWEPAIPDVGIYSTKFDILDTTHPIASIDKLYKVDFATGVQTLLTDAVVAGDGLSFTSASLTDGDLVNVIYFYATANPEGLTTVTYLNSNTVLVDRTTGIAYVKTPYIDNGVFGYDFVEVV